MPFYCHCGEEIRGRVFNCPCGRRWLFKMKSGRYVYAGRWR